MKKLVGLGLALALLTLATPVFGPPGPILPYCWNVNGTQCSTPGQTIHCTDGIWSDYICTCYQWQYSYPPHPNTWDCDEVR